MAMRRAIVSTSLGAEGISGDEGEYLLLADTPESFAQAVVELLQDNNRRLELGARAAQMVRERYDWSAIIPRVESVYPSG